MPVINKKKISMILSEENKFSLVKKILKYAAGKIFKISKKIIFELDLKKNYPEVAIEQQLLFRLATQQDIDSMDEEHYDYDEKSKQYSKDRLKKGDKCVLAVLDNRIIGYLWLMKDYMELSQYNYILLSKNRAYTYKGFVLKEYRGKRIHAAMYKYIITMLKKERKRFVVSSVETSNKPGLKSKSRDRAKYEQIGKIIQIKFLGLKYDYINKKTLKYLQSSHLSE